jgi:hypothetical protein
MEENKNDISSGSRSINLGARNSVENSNFHIGDVHNHRDTTSEPIALIDRVQSKPLKVTGKPVKAAWLIVSGIVGFIGSIASIASLWPNFPLWLAVLLPFAVFCLIVGISLARQRFIRIPYLPFNLEADRKGKVFLTKIEGDCPLCDGKLKLRDIGPNDHKVTCVRCTRNPDHIWNFDFTVLDEPEG